MYICRIISSHLPWRRTPLTACNYWSKLGSVHQVPITAGWCEVAWNWDVFPIPLHMTRSVNQTPDLLILSPTSYPLSPMFPCACTQNWVTQTHIVALLNKSSIPPTWTPQPTAPAPTLLRPVQPIPDIHLLSRDPGFHGSATWKVNNSNFWVVSLLAPVITKPSLLAVGCSQSEDIYMHIHWWLPSRWGSFQLCVVWWLWQRVSGKFILPLYVYSRIRAGPSPDMNFALTP